MLRYRTGVAGSAAAGRNMAQYLVSQSLTPEDAQTLAKYYVDGMAPGQDSPVAALRPDMDPRLAERLGLDLSRPLTVEETGHLLDGRRADGEKIEGRQIRKPGRSVAEVFGLDMRTPPTGAAVDNIFTGLRTDGIVPELPGEVIEGAIKRFTAMYGVPSHRADAPLPEEVANMRAGKMATGVEMNGGDYRRLVTAKRLPVSYVDLVLSPDKSVSAAFALAPTDAERAIVAQIHKEAVSATLQHVEAILGYTRKGDGGRDGIEEGKIGWVRFAHFSSRPTAETAQQDEQGRSYTAVHRVPVRTPDFQLHDHSIIFNTVETATKAGAMDLDRLAGAVHEIGAVYQGHVSRLAQERGIEVVRDDTAARFTAVPRHVCEHFSKRHKEGELAASEYAVSQGLDWDKLTDRQRGALLEAGTETKKLSKGETGLGSFDEWKKQARDELGYQHRSVLRSNSPKRELTPEQRIEIGYTVAQPLLADEFSRNTKISADRVRAIAAQAMIGPGIKNASELSVLTKLFQERGVKLDGPDKPATMLILGEDAVVRGKQRISVTTTRHVDREQTLVDLAVKAHAEKAPEIATPDLERAIERRGLTLNDEQRAAVERIADGSRLEIVVAVAGAGKSRAMLPPLVDSWREQGRDVHGIAQAWKHSTGGLDGSGIEKDNLLSIAQFLKREKNGQIELSPNSVVVVDEVGRLGTREMLQLLEVRERTGAQVMMLGDPKQVVAVEAGGPIDLLAKAMPGAIPEVLTTMRQRTEREREIASMFREGRASEALEMKRVDNTVELVAGGSKRTIQRVADLWHERMEANRDNPDFTISISAPSNQDARAISLAIRKGRQERGEIGPDTIVIPAVDKNSRETYDLALSVGDKVRLFDRVHDADRPKGSSRQVLASNGDIVDVLALSGRGMIVRNEAGNEGLVEWSKLRPYGEQKTGRVQLALGYALTIDTAQGMTSTEHISALPNGTKAVPRGKHYTAESRHRETTWLVIDEAAERRQITKSRPLGGETLVREADVWQRVAENMSRRTDKANATDFVKKSVSVQRGGVNGFQAGMERSEQRELVGLARTRAREVFDTLRQKALHLAHSADLVQRHAIERARQAMRHTAGRDVDQQQARRQSQTRGPTLSM